MLFSERSIWTMVHGIFLSGAALMALAAALFYLYTLRVSKTPAADETSARALGQLTVFIPVALWLSVLVGMYIIFPLYRAVPPAEAVELARYPKALIEADPDNAWLHSFAMELKEHVPWIASILATAVGYVGVRHRRALVHDRSTRNMAATLLAISLVLVAVAGFLGTLINKFAPLD